MQSKQEIHDRCAPFLAISLVIFATVRLSTNWLDPGAVEMGMYWILWVPPGVMFYSEACLSKTGKAPLFRFFTPAITVLIFVAVCLGTETAQYFKLYNRTFDPFDLVADISLLVPLFILVFSPSGFYIQE
jgi:hypothetical protein